MKLFFSTVYHVWPISLNSQNLFTYLPNKTRIFLQTFSSYQHTRTFNFEKRVIFEHIYYRLLCLFVCTTNSFVDFPSSSFSVFLSGKILFLFDEFVIYSTFFFWQNTRNKIFPKKIESLIRRKKLLFYFHELCVLCL